MQSASSTSAGASRTAGVCARRTARPVFNHCFWRDHRGRQHTEYVRKADLEAVRNACEGRRDDLTRIREALVRSEQAVTWLLYGKLRRSGKMDRNEQFARCCETIDRLLDCATGEIGTPSLTIKALQAVAPLILAAQHGWWSTHRLTPGIEASFFHAWKPAPTPRHWSESGPH